MTGETERTVSGWTIDTLATQIQALRAADERWQQERDRRYTEVGIEREKALRIKEEADRRALGLAREIQTYKDEKANELRSQIESERGGYATKDDLLGAIKSAQTDLAAFTAKYEAQHKPIQDFIASQQGRDRGIGSSASALAVAATILISLLAMISYIYVNSHHQAQPIIVTVPTRTAP